MKRLRLLRPSTAPFRASSIQIHSQKRYRLISLVPWNISKMSSSAFYAVTPVIPPPPTPDLCACRIMQDSKAMAQLRSEIDLIRGLDHPNIIRLQEVFETEDSLYLVMVRKKTSLRASWLVGRSTISSVSFLPPCTPPEPVPGFLMGYCCSQCSHRKVGLIVGLQRGGWGLVFSTFASLIF